MEEEEKMEVANLVDEVKEIEVDVDISVPPPTPPARSQLMDMEDDMDEFDLDDDSPTMGQSQRSLSASLPNIKSRAGATSSSWGGNHRSPSRISLARRQQMQAIDPLRRASLYPSQRNGTHSPLNHSQDLARQGVQSAIKEAMSVLYESDNEYY